MTTSVMVFFIKTPLYSTVDIMNYILRKMEDMQVRVRVRFRVYGAIARGKNAISV